MAGRVLVAMSGGVDSSVAAARLTRAGHDVIGVTLHLWDYPDDGSVRARCCAPEDLHDARRVADKLGIPHYAFDRRELFAESIVEPFVEDYLAGRTPSPCVSCNRGVKLAELFALAERLGAERVATGHYARLHEREGRVELLRARDASKDQSYFLHWVGQAELRKLCFPLGDSEKGAVRDEARALELPGANKGESQELCFIPTGRYDAFIEERAGERLRPGPIVDASGRVVGEHRGVHAFTLGQRKNLGVALGERAYVVGIEPASATVRLGPRSALEAAAAELTELSLAEGVTLPLRADVQIRYRARPVPAEVRALGAGALVQFETKVVSVVPGQYAVFYDGDRVLGGGRITRSLPMAPTELPA
ncbi:MAG TPA: tRNA 2-thiouridine(34) synthase MnmA [Polyangiaceae bacterium]|nr:tRNA 2-thiouridine(34) synthase MnmA [Polyangiaceae bacterium]